MAKTKMESFARFSSNSLHSIYSQRIAFEQQYLMSIYSSNLSSQCVTFQSQNQDMALSHTFPSTQSTTFRNIFSMFLRYNWTFQPYLSNPIISFHPYLIGSWPLVNINSGHGQTKIKILYRIFLDLNLQPGYFNMYSLLFIFVSVKS